MSINAILAELRNRDKKNITISLLLHETDLLRILEILQQTNFNLTRIKFHSEQRTSNAMSEIKKCLQRNQKICDEWFSLINAFNQNKTEFIVAFIERYPFFKIDCVDDLGYTVLHRAAMNGNIALITLLITQLNMNVMLRDSSRDTALHLAAARGDLNTVKSLVELCSREILEDFMKALNKSCKTALGMANNNRTVIEFLTSYQNNLICQANISIQDGLFQAHAVIADYIDKLEQCMHAGYFKVPKIKKIAAGVAVSTSKGRCKVPRNLADIYEALKKMQNIQHLEQLNKKLCGISKKAWLAVTFPSARRAKQTAAFYRAWVAYDAKLKSHADAVPEASNELPHYDVLATWLIDRQDMVPLTSNTGFISLYPQAPISQDISAKDSGGAFIASSSISQEPDLFKGQSESDTLDIKQLAQRIWTLESRVAVLEQNFEYLQNSFAHLLQQHQQLWLLSAHERLMEEWTMTLNHPSHINHQRFFNKLMSLLSPVCVSGFLINSSYIERARKTLQENITNIILTVMESLPFMGAMSKSGDVISQVFGLIHDALPTINLAGEFVPANVKTWSNAVFSFITGAGDERLSRMITFASSLRDIEKRLFDICRMITMVYGEQIAKLASPDDVDIFATSINDILIKTLKDGDEQAEKILTDSNSNEQILLALAISKARSVGSQVNIQSPHHADVTEKVSVRRLLQTTGLTYYTEKKRKLMQLRPQTTKSEELEKYGYRQVSEEQALYLCQETYKRRKQVWINEQSGAVICEPMSVASFGMSVPNHCDVSPPTSPRTRSLPNIYGQEQQIRQDIKQDDSREPAKKSLSAKITLSKSHSCSFFIDSSDEDDSSDVEELSLFTGNSMPSSSSF